MKRSINFLIVAVVASSLFFPVFACDDKDGDAGEDESWRKLLEEDDESGEDIADDWRDAMKIDDDDPSEDADAEWRKAMKKDDDSDDEAEEDWREAMKKDK